MAAGTLLLVAHPATWPLAQTVLQAPPSPDLTYPPAWGCNGIVGTDFGGEAAICRFRWFPVDKHYSLVTSGSSAWVGRSVPAHGLRTGFVRARTSQVISWADHTSCHPPPLGTRSPGAARWVSPEPLGPPSTGSLGLLHGHGSPRKRGGAWNLSRQEQ